MSDTEHFLFSAHLLCFPKSSDRKEEVCYLQYTPSVPRVLRQRGGCSSRSFRTPGIILAEKPSLISRRRKGSANPFPAWAYNTEEDRRKTYYFTFLFFPQNIMAQAAAQAAAAQAQVDLDGLNDCLTVCGLRTAALRNGITVREGKRSLEEFGQFQPDDIPELVKSLARNAPTTQRVYYSFTQQKNLQTLSFWVQERLATNQPLDAALWTAAVMKTTGERMLANGMFVTTTTKAQQLLSNSLSNAHALSICSNDRPW